MATAFPVTSSPLAIDAVPVENLQTKIRNTLVRGWGKDSAAVALATVGDRKNRCVPYTIASG